MGSLFCWGIAGWMKVGYAVPPSACKLWTPSWFPAPLEGVLFRRGLRVTRGPGGKQTYSEFARNQQFLNHGS